MSAKAFLPALGLFVQTIEVASVLGHIGVAHLSDAGFAVRDHELRFEVSEAMSVLSDAINDLEAAVGLEWCEGGRGSCRLVL